MMPGFGPGGGTMYMQPQMQAQYPPGSIGGGVMGMPPGAGVPFELGGGPISHGTQAMPTPSHAATPYFSPSASFTGRRSIYQETAGIHNVYTNVESVERNTPDGTRVHPGSPQLRPHAAPGSIPRTASSGRQQQQKQNGTNGASGAGVGGGAGAGARGGGQNGTPATKKAKINYYEIIGVPQDATDDMIKKAYRKKAVHLHPDKNPDDPEAEHRFALLSEAYTALMDPVKRIDHNKELAGGNAGWGWNQEAAKARASNYQWNGDDMLFNLGAQMQAARQRKKSGPLARCWEGIFGYR